MKFRVIVEPEAEINASDIYHFIRSRSPMNADRWFEGLFAAIDSLDDMPRRWKLAVESKALGREVRQLNYGVYRILFVIEDDEVHVLHIRHGSRLPWKPE